MLFSSVVFYFAFLCSIVPNHGLEAYRGKVPTDIFRDILNQIFSSLKLITSRNSKIQEYSTIHDFFVNRARLHAHDWKEELNLTSLHIDNGATYFTAIINDVLKEEKDIGQINYMRHKTDVVKFIENFNSKLAKLIEILFLRNHSRSDLYTEVTQLFTSPGQTRTNDTEEELEFVEGSAEKMEVWVPVNSRRIFEGATSSIKEYPFVASIHVLNQFTCAGSIIDKDLIITAASGLQIAYNNRFYRENPKFLTVRVGSSFFNGAGKQIPALEVYFHPSYDPKTLHNNLAIIRLDKNIKLKKHFKKVRRINMDTHPWALPMNTDGVTIVGWGARSIDRSDESYRVFLQYKDHSEVTPIAARRAYVTAQHFCAGFVSRGSGACNRDVGAPGVVRGVLTGVASFGSPSCGAPDSPTVFTKLGYYTDWIEEILELEHPRLKITTNESQTKPYLWHTMLSTTFTDKYIEPVEESKMSKQNLHNILMFEITPVMWNETSPVPNNMRELGDYKMKKKEKYRYTDFNVDGLRDKKGIHNQKIRIKEKFVSTNSKEFPDLTRAKYETGGAANVTYARGHFKSHFTDMKDYNEGENSSNEPVPKYTGSNIESGALVEEPPLQTSSEQSLEEEIDQLFEKMSKAGKNKKGKKKTNDKKKHNKHNEENSDDFNNSSYLNGALAKSETSEVSSDVSQTQGA